MTTKEPEDKLARAREQALAQFHSIEEMVGKLRAADDDDAYEEVAESLAREAGFIVSSGEDAKNEVVYFWHKAAEPGDVFLEATHTPFAYESDAWVGCCDENNLRPDADEARRAIEEDALSVQVRSDWHSPGEKGEAVEYEILLCTGGPAVRIVGDLGMCNEPDDARIECQDWFTPWTEVFDGIDRDTLLAYARCFYFGDA